MSERTGRRGRHVKPGDSYEEGEEVELEEVDPDPDGTEPADETTPADIDPPDAAEHAADQPQEGG